MSLPRGDDNGAPCTRGSLVGLLAPTCCANGRRTRDSSASWRIRNRPRASAARPTLEPCAGRCRLLLPCRGERNRVSFDPHDRHTSPNRSYGTPGRGLAAMTLLSATGVPLGVPQARRAASCVSDLVA